VLVALQFGLGKGTREQKQALVKKVLVRLLNRRQDGCVHSLT
jgi:hypothetical protein